MNVGSDVRLSTTDAYAVILPSPPITFTLTRAFCASVTPVCAMSDLNADGGQPRSAVLHRWKCYCAGTNIGACVTRSTTEA